MRRLGGDIFLVSVPSSTIALPKCSVICVAFCWCAWAAVLGIPLLLLFPQTVLLEPIGPVWMPF